MPRSLVVILLSAALTALVAGCTTPEPGSRSPAALAGQGGSGGAGSSGGSSGGY